MFECQLFLKLVSKILAHENMFETHFRLGDKQKKEGS